MNTIETHCDFHLGDNLFQLHFLRGLAAAHPEAEFVHAAHGCHLEQLREAVADVPRIRLVPLEERAPWSLSCWKNEGNFFGGMAESPDYYEFYLRWFAHHAAQLGLESPFTKMTDLLFDYPALLAPVCPGLVCDTLFVNSQPCSGQWLAYDGAEAQRMVLDGIAREMAARTRLVVTQRVEDSAIPCTRDLGLSVTGIGHLSLRCAKVVMIGTGPAWPTCNVFNLATVRTRIVLMQPERVNFAPGIRHVRDFAELRLVLAGEDLL